MKIHLSDGEWKLMDRLWEDGPATITQLTRALGGGDRLVQAHHHHHALPAGGQGGGDPP